MTLQKKTLYAIVIALLALVFVLDWVSRAVVLKSFVELEEKDAAQNVQRVLSALTDRLQAMQSSASDWAEWDDTYNYIQGKMPEYEEVNLTASTSFLNLRVNLMAFVRLDGEIFYMKAVDLNTEQTVPVPESLQRLIRESPSLYQLDEVGKKAAGFISIPEGLVLLSSQAVARSDRTGPIHGVIIFGRYFDASEIQRLSKTTLYALSAFRIDDPALPLDFRQALSSLNGDPVLVRALSAETIAGYALVKDISGKPVQILRADTPRKVFIQGSATVAYYKWVLLAATSLFGLVILLFIRRIVLGRLTRLNREVGQIAASSEVCKRVSVHGKDELAGLATAVNNMLEALERSRADLVNSQERLREAHRMETVGKLAGGVAHDFNNLMTVITGYGEVLRDELASGDSKRKDLEEILKAAERATKLTSQLLSFSRKQLVQAEVVNPVDLMRAKEEMWKQLAGESVELTILPASAPGRIKVDPGQFEEAVTNVILNACEAMPKGGRIVIETANADMDENYTERHHERVASGTYVMVAVTDNGHGFDEKIRAHLFEPFFTTKDKSKNAGLGLATTYGIVKQAGGYIFVYSEVGHGTTVKIYLPRVQEMAAAAAPQDGALPHGTETILLAEDEPMVRTLSARVLQEQGYHLLEAASGVDALTLAEEFGQSKIDLLLTDVVMPHMGGKELADKLKSERPNLKVLFASGYTDETIVRQGILDRSIPFIQKPFSPKTLVRKVREVLDQ